MKSSGVSVVATFETSRHPQSSWSLNQIQQKRLGKYFASERWDTDIIYDIAIYNRLSFCFPYQANAERRKRHKLINSAMFSPHLSLFTKSRMRRRIGRIAETVVGGSAAGFVTTEYAKARNTSAPSNPSRENRGSQGTQSAPEPSPKESSDSPSRDKPTRAHTKPAPSKKIAIGLLPVVGTRELMLRSLNDNGQKEKSKPIRLLGKNSVLLSVTGNIDYWFPLQVLFCVKKHNIIPSLLAESAWRKGTSLRNKCYAGSSFECATHRARDIHVADPTNGAKKKRVF